MYLYSKFFHFHAMRIFFIFLLLAISTTILSAQNPTIPVFPREFSAIDLRGNVRAKITIADSSSTVIELHGLRIKDVTWRVKNGTLFVEVPSGLLDSHGYAEVKISQPNISKITTSGAEIESATPLRGASLTIETAGSVNTVKLDVDVDQLTVKSVGASDIGLRGHAATSHLTANVGSRIDCLSLIADSVYATAGEASEIYVNAGRLLSAKANTSATIYYTGGSELELKTKLFGAVIEITTPEHMTWRLKSDSVAPNKIPAAESPQVKPVKVKQEKVEIEKSTKKSNAPAQNKSEKLQEKQEPIESSNDGDFF